MLLLVGPSPTRIGGIATYLRALSADLRATVPGAGWEHFVTDKGVDAASPLWKRLGAGARLASALMARLSRAPPRLVHLHCGGDHLGWGLREAHLHMEFAQRCGARTILHLHAPDLDGYARRSGGDAALLRKLLALPDRVVTVAPALGAEAVRHGASAHRVRVVPYGMPTGALRLPRNRAASVAAPLRILMVAVVEPRKGPDILLDAIERLRAARGPVVEVDVVGPFRCNDTVKARWIDEGQRLGVHFLGPCAPDAVGAHLERCDVVVHPARADALPFAVLEAMVAARPVVASAVGGLTDLLADGGGVTVPPEEPAALAEALLTLVDDPERRLDVAASGYHTVRRRHAPARSRDAIFEVYRDLLGVGSDEQIGAALLHGR